MKKMLLAITIVSMVMLRMAPAEAAAASSAENSTVAVQQKILQIYLLHMDLMVRMMMVHLERFMMLILMDIWNSGHITSSQIMELG